MFKLTRAWMMGRDTFFISDQSDGPLQGTVWKTQMKLVLDIPQSSEFEILV